MILHVPACLACKQTCLYTFTYHHIINPSLIPHRCTTPSLYDCAGCLPNPSLTPIWVQLKPCLTHASTKGPMQTNRRPKEPGARQSKQTTMTTMTRTSQVMNKKQQMGWRTTMTMMRTTPQCQEVVDKGVPWNKASLEGTTGTIIVDHALISLFFFFFCFHNYLLFFYRKTAHDWAQGDMEQSPQRYARHNCYNHALLSFFFCFLTTYLVFTGKPPTIGLMMTGNRPHKSTPGNIVMMVPYIFFSFFFFEYLFFIYLQENCPQRYARHNRNDHALFSFLFLNTYSFYRKTAHVRAHDDMELSPPRYAGHDHNDRALFPSLFYFILFWTLTFFFSFRGELPTIGLAMTGKCPHLLN